MRFSGDLYRDQPINDLIADPLRVLGALRPPSDEAADTGGMIPIHPRANYHSYLSGTGAQLSSTVPGASQYTFVLEFEEFVYNHPASGFNGNFNQAPTRSIRFTLASTSSPGFYSGIAYDGATKFGTVSIRWISSFYRRAHVQVNTLEGAGALPAEVEGATFATIFADAGWEVSVTDGGTIPLPAALSGVNIRECWGPSNLRKLMASVPGYNPTDLDSVWRVHLLAVPANRDCVFGIMFDRLFGDPNGVPREGAATFSHTVHRPEDSAYFGWAANREQHNVPRAYLRSAAHELGHAFSQVHTIGVEGPADNSIMTSTIEVAALLGSGGGFPDQLKLAFNDRGKTHLRHLPDPAVRPGAMMFRGEGNATPSPEAVDVAWLEVLELSVEPSSDRVALGEPITLSWTLTNRGQTAVPAPAELEVESLVARVSVTDPTGRIGFMRPAEILSCPRISIVPLEPGVSVRGSTTMFWGWDGFAFQIPGGTWSR